MFESPKNEMNSLPEELKKDKNKSLYKVPILMYHYVEYVTDKKDTTRQLLNVAPHIFEAQLKSLLSANYTFITAKDLGQILDEKRLLPEKPVILTFDDSHRDFYYNVYPLLKKYNVKASMYVITDFLEDSDFLTHAQLKEIVESNLVDIGAHTAHHVSLKGLPASVVEEEVYRSKSMIEDEFHIKIVSFAYPNGDFDQQSADIVRDAGFTTAVSTIPGNEVGHWNRYFIYRLRPGFRTGQELIDYLEEAYQ